MSIAPNKTKIVCTIGPACNTPEMLQQMLIAGMNVARLNFSHGDFRGHQATIARLRAAAQAAGRPLAIMADLPGPKMRIGQLKSEPIELSKGDSFTLTTDEIVGDEHRVSISFAQLPAVVKPGDTLFLNDGIIQVEVTGANGTEVTTKVLVGGELRSRKGLNLPGINLGISAFTDHDRDCLQAALEGGVDAISQSFVESAADILAVRRAATKLGYRPFIIAKIERAGALPRVDEILQVADGLMVARGDLGVEIPMEQIAVVQKQLIARANAWGKPVITATQMLASMVDNSRPTRSEATDVANAILDGTDCVMLSEESAMGKYPVQAVRMLAKIGAATEPHRPAGRTLATTGNVPTPVATLIDLIARNVQQTVDYLRPAAVIVPTTSGYTARMIARFKPPVWVTAVSPLAATCQDLQFSYGVQGVHTPIPPADWSTFAQDWVRAQGLPASRVVLTSGPSKDNPSANYRLEIIDIPASGAPPAETTGTWLHQPHHETPPSK